MLVQVWFTINKLPVIPESVQKQFTGSCENIFEQIGNEMDGRQLVRASLESNLIQPLQTQLEAMEKAPVICDVRKQNGVRYGFRKNIIDLETGEYEIIAELDVDENPIATFSINEAEHDKHMQPFDIEIDGVTITQTPPDNTTSGWAGWNSRI